MHLSRHQDSGMFVLSVLACAGGQWSRAGAPRKSKPRALTSGAAATFGVSPDKVGTSLCLWSSPLPPASPATSKSPSGALGKAVAYSLSLWHKLTRFVELPEIELSTNVAENSMRPVAIGRKNRNYVGSENAGPKVAAILSVVETCRRLSLPVRACLASVLPRPGYLPIKHIVQCTPAARAASRS
jgi:hypothetical protein